MGRIVRLLNLPCPCDFVDVSCSIFFALAAGSATCPDYVFGDGCNLVPLGDLEIFITREGHLPKIASEAEVRARGGVNLSELQIQLLEKIEELTLHTIALEKRINVLESE